MTARILTVTPNEYHRLPGFSSTLAKILISKSPAHAKDAYDRQQERVAAEDASDDEELSDDKRKRLRTGTIRHALVLGIGKRVEVIPADILATNGAISTKAAKEFCARVEREGGIPVKEAEIEIHERSADAVRARLADAGHHLTGTSELAIGWPETTPTGLVECRAMLDHVELWGPPDAPTGATISDLKNVADAHPERCQRSAETLGYAIQACVYKRALNALYPTLAGRVDFRFLFVETQRPYALWDPERLAGPFQELGERRWLRALHTWSECWSRGEWPAYRTAGNNEINAPMWTLRQEGFTPEEM